MPKRMLKNDAPQPGGAEHAGEKDAGRVNSSAIGATEDTPSRRSARSGGLGVSLQQPPRKGLMIDYDYCTGCHSCEVACKQEHNYPAGRGGIALQEILTEKPDESYRIDYIPFPTLYCDLCAARTAQGEQPACVKHCQARTMYYGDVTELAKTMEDKPHCALFTPR